MPDFEDPRSPIIDDGGLKFLEPSGHNAMLPFSTLAYTPCEGELGMVVAASRKTDSSESDPIKDVFLPLEPYMFSQVIVGGYYTSPWEPKTGDFPLLKTAAAIDREPPFIDTTRMFVARACVMPYNWTVEEDSRVMILDTTPDAIATEEEKSIPGYVPNPGLTMLSKTHYDFDLEKWDDEEGVGYLWTYNPAESRFIWTKSEPTVAAGDFTVGSRYKIITVGDTDFVAIGARFNIVGFEFTATGIGEGTGTAINRSFSHWEVRTAQPADVVKYDYYDDIAYTIQGSNNVRIYLESAIAGTTFLYSNNGAYPYDPYVDGKTIYSTSTIKWLSIRDGIESPVYTFVVTFDEEGLPPVGRVVVPQPTTLYPFGGLDLNEPKVICFTLNEGGIRKVLPLYTDQGVSPADFDEHFVADPEDGKDNFYPHPELLSITDRYNDNLPSTLKHGTDYEGVPFVPPTALTGLIRTCAYHYGLVLSNTYATGSFGQYYAEKSALESKIWDQVGFKLLYGQPVRIKIGKAKAEWDKSTGELSLSSETVDCIVVYSLDGSEPKTKYTDPIEIVPDEVTAPSIERGITYLVLENGTTDFLLIGMRDVVVTAGSFETGEPYKILEPGDTDFTAVGAANNNVGTVFTATGEGEGTGTASFMNFEGRVFRATDAGTGTGKVKVKTVSVTWKVTKGCMEDSDVWETFVAFNNEDEGPEDFETFYFSELPAFSNSPIDAVVELQRKPDWYVSETGDGEGRTPDDPADARYIIGVKGVPERDAYTGSTVFSPPEPGSPKVTKVDDIMGLARGPRFIRSFWAKNNKLVLWNVGDFPPEPDPAPPAVSSRQLAFTAPNKIEANGYFWEDTKDWEVGDSLFVSGSDDNGGAYTITGFPTQTTITVVNATITNEPYSGVNIPFFAELSPQILYSLDDGYTWEDFPPLGFSVTTPRVIAFKTVGDLDASSDTTGDKGTDYTHVFSHFACMGAADIHVKWAKETSRLTLTVLNSIGESLTDFGMEFLLGGSPYPAESTLTEPVDLVLRVLHNKDWYASYFSAVSSETVIGTITPGVTADFETDFSTTFESVDDIENTTLFDDHQGPDLIWFSEGNYSLEASWGDPSFYSESIIMLRGGYNASFTERDVKEFKTVFKAIKATGESFSGQFWETNWEYGNGEEIYEHNPYYVLVAEKAFVDGFWGESELAQQTIEFTNYNKSESGDYVWQKSTGQLAHSVTSHMFNIHTMYNCHFDWTFHNLKPATAAGYYGQGIFNPRIIDMSYFCTIKIDASCPDGADSARWTGAEGGLWNGIGQQSRVEGINIPNLTGCKVDIKARTGNSGNGSNGSFYLTDPGYGYWITDGGQGGYNQILISFKTIIRCDINIDVQGGNGGNGGDAVQWYNGEVRGRGSIGGDANIHITGGGNYMVESTVNIVGVSGNGGDGAAHPTSVQAIGYGGSVDFLVQLNSGDSVIDLDLTGGAAGDKGGTVHESPSDTVARITQSQIASEITANIKGSETLSVVNVSTFNPVYRPKLYGTAKLLQWDGWDPYSQIVFFKKDEDLDFIETDPDAAQTGVHAPPYNKTVYGNPVRVDGLFVPSVPSPVQAYGWFSGTAGGNGAPLPGYTIPASGPSWGGGAAWFLGRYWERYDQPAPP